MKVDILIAVAEKGGVENIINMMLPFWQKQCGWDVRIVQLVWEGYRWVSEEEHFFPLLYGREGHTMDEFVSSYAKFLAESGCPDVVLATAWPYMCYVARKALAMTGSKSTKIISWLHAPVERYKAVGYGGHEHLALADAHLAISESIYNDLNNNLLNALVLKVRNPVDFSGCISSSIADGVSPTKYKKLYFVGRIAPEKRLDVIIRAIAENNGNWRLYIVGDGEEQLKVKLKQLASVCKVSKYIQWLGWQSEPWTCVENADAVVLASEYEGFPMVAIEALYNGIPVISTPVSGIVELIKPGVNGYLYPMGDWESLALVLQMIYEGKMPAIDAENCKMTVKKFNAEDTIMDFACKVNEVVLHKHLMVKDIIEDELYVCEKISVIVPAYNAALYIEECIQSLLKQTISLKMLEIIIVDDASQDQTCEVVRRYEEKYPENILFIACQENGGPGMARNIGLSYASGDYIAFVDADDKIKPDMLQKLYEKLVLYKCDMSGCCHVIFDKEEVKGKVNSEERLYNLTISEEKKQYILNHGSKNSVWSHMYRKEFLVSNNILFPEGIYMEDLYFHQMCMMQAARCYEMSEALYMYRSNGAGIMQSVNTSYLLDVFVVQEHAYQEMIQKDLICGYEEELAVLYYVKAFIEPTHNMERGLNGIKWDDEILQMLREVLLEHFPDIKNNRYLLQDKGEFNVKYFELLLK